MSLNLICGCTDLHNTYLDYLQRTREQILPGRTIEDENAQVPNIVAQGLLQLNGPLREYNAALVRSQARQRMVLLVKKGANHALVLFRARAAPENTKR